MVYKITIPYLQIGEFRVKTPVGLSELLEGAWSHPSKVEIDEDFINRYDRTVSKNEKGQIVTWYTLKEGESK